jgi:DNA end-binding protein Ku
VRAIWKGAVSFGLVNVPVRLFAATQEHDIRFHQVHRADGGRIRMKRTCSVCGEEVSYDQLAKGYEAEDGRLVILTEDDFEQLPLATGHEIDVVEFVPSEQVDPMMFGRSYYLEPDARALKPYALLREALNDTERMAVVKVALRQRESLAVLRVRDKVIVLQTLLWPDEIRAADFEVLDTDVELRPLVESMAAEFEPEQYSDDYQKALADLVEAKLAGAEPAPMEAEDVSGGGRDVVDLLSALQASVDRAKSSRGEEPAPVRKAAPAKKTAAKKAPAKKTAAAAKSTAKKTTTTTKKAAAKKSTTKTAAKRRSA